jgi:hypothetical protein
MVRGQGFGSPATEPGADELRIMAAAMIKLISMVKAP